MPDSDSITLLATRFRQFAENESRGYSPLYERLSMGVADDRELLAIAAHARDGQPPPNMLFGAVRFLLLRGITSPCSRFFVTLSREDGPPDNAFPLFRSFCIEHRDELIDILQTRRVQTNEVGRSAILYPVFAMIAGERRKGMGLIEIGASAGLNLNWDLYRYHYGSGVICGREDSPLMIEAELRGDSRPPLPNVPPSIVSKVGVDLNPVDITDRDDALWLQSLVWPEHRQRAERLSAAMAVAQKSPPRLVAGNGVDSLPILLSELADDTLPIIFHTFALYQFPTDFTRLTNLLTTLSHGHELYHVSIESRRGMDCDVVVMYYRDGTVTVREPATAHPHGAWIEWHQTPDD